MAGSVNKAILVDLYKSGKSLTEVEVLVWVDWLTLEERKLVWARAIGTSWRTLCWKMGKSRTTVWKMWTTALMKIHAKLKENIMLDTILTPITRITYDGCSKIEEKGEE